MPGLKLTTSHTPAAVGVTVNARTTTIASASFKPSAGSVLVVMAAFYLGAGGNTWTTASVTDSLGTHLTWHQVYLQKTTTGTQVAVAWWAKVGTTAPGTMTVTVHGAVTTGQTIYSAAVQVLTLTGATTTSPIGTTDHGALTAAKPFKVTVTPTKTGSGIVCIGIRSPGVASTSTLSGTYRFIKKNENYLLDHGTSTGLTLTTSTTPVAVGVTPSTAVNWQYLAFEILPTSSGPVTKTAAGTLTGAGMLTATGSVVQAGAAALQGSGVLTATGSVPVETAAGTAAASGVLSAAGTLVLGASGMLGGSGTLSATATTQTRSASGLLVAAGTLTATGAVIYGASATLSASGRLWAPFAYADPALPTAAVEAGERMRPLLVAVITTSVATGDKAHFNRQIVRRAWNR